MGYSALFLEYCGRRLLEMRDIFREAVEKAKKTGVWEKLSQAQKAEMIVRYLGINYGSAANEGKT